VALTQVPAHRWKQLPGRLKDRIQEHTLTVLAAGVAFYGFLAFVPTLVVIVSVYGLFADPATIDRQVQANTTALPDEARRLIVSQFDAIAGSAGTSLTIAALVSVLVALWSASAGVTNLMKGIAVASGTIDNRNFAVKRGLALALTLGAACFVVFSALAIAVLPAVVAGTGMGSGGRTLINLLRFPLIALALMAGLGVLYRFSATDGAARTIIVSWGSLIAAGLWIVGSIGFSYYTANVGSYNELYGSLGAIVVMLLWLWISAFVVLLGAEINAELRT
jgi:membrane protein